MTVRSLRTLLAAFLPLLVIVSGECAAQDGFGYIGGDQQVAPPSTRLPRALSVRGTSRILRYTIVSDGTGGAVLGNGRQEEYFGFPFANEVHEPLTFGPRAGDVVVHACANDYLSTIFGLTFACGDVVIFHLSARPDCPLSPPAVTLETEGAARTGRRVTFSAIASCGAGGFTYLWDLDGDGVTEWTSQSNQRTVYVAETPVGTPTVRVRDAAGAEAIGELAVHRQAPRLVAVAADVATEECGDGDGFAEPGERWRVPVRITNQGDLAASEGLALFSGAIEAEIGNGSGPRGDLVVETPIVDVFDLSPSVSTTVSVVVRLNPDAACGSTQELSLLGSIDANGPAGGTSAVARFTLPPADRCQVSRRCPVVVSPTVAPVAGDFIDRQQQDNWLGVSLPSGPAGERIFSALWSTGDARQLPTWYSLQAPLTGTGVVAPIERYTLDLAAPEFAVTHRTVGRAVLAMRDPEHLLFHWYLFGRRGTESLRRAVSNPGPARYAGAWYNSAEAGTGLFITPYLTEPNADLGLAVSHFLYDAHGQPVWARSFGPLVRDAAGTESFDAQAEVSISVSCPGCAYSGEIVDKLRKSGTTRLTFGADSDPRFGTEIVLPFPLEGAWSRAGLPIVNLAKPNP